MAQTGTLTATADHAVLPAQEVGRVRALWRRLRQSKGALVGLAILIALIIAAIAAPLIAPFDPIKVTDNALFSPGSPYLFGTDQYGRDILSRLIFGARISLTIGLISVGIAATFGVTIGLLAGYYSGWIDALLMYVINVMLAVPGI